MKHKTRKFRIICLIIAATVLTNAVALGKESNLRPLAAGERSGAASQAIGDSVRKRLAREVRKIWQDFPNFDRRDGNEIATQLSKQNPQLFREAERYFGGATWVAQLASLLAKPAENLWSYAKFENPNEPEDFKDLLAKLRGNNERWIIAIDGKSGKTTLWVAIQGKEVVLGELLEEMEFVEGEKQLFDLHQAVIHDKNLPFDIQYGLETNPDELNLWVDKMVKKHGKFLRDLGINTSNPAEIMKMIFANANDIDGFCRDFLKSLRDRIIVYNANGSHEFVDNKLATDVEFPPFNVAKVEVIPSGDSRIVRIQYSKLGISASAMVGRIPKEATEIEQGI